MKKVLHVDKFSITRANGQGATQETVLNDFISSTETKLKTSFSQEEKVKLKDNAEGFLKSWIRQFYDFPNASDKFNIEALGVDLEGISQEFKNKSKLWSKYPYLLEEGVFKLNTEAIQEKYTTYTSNEFQSEALEIAQELIKLVERAQLKGILNTDPHTSIKIREAFKGILALNIQEDKPHNLIPNPAIPHLGKIELPHNFRKLVEQE